MDKTRLAKEIFDRSDKIYVGRPRLCPLENSENNL
jgi:hypothetical protein